MVKWHEYWPTAAFLPLQDISLFLCLDFTQIDNLHVLSPFNAPPKWWIHYLVPSFIWSFGDTLRYWWKSFQAPAICSCLITFLTKAGKLFYLIGTVALILYTFSRGFVNIWSLSFSILWLVDLVGIHCFRSQ